MADCAGYTEGVGSTSGSTIMQIATFDEFTGLKLAGLEGADILALNFFAGRGLPGLHLRG